MDKLTIRPKKLLELSKRSNQLPTSSQPSPKQIENLYDYLASYYESVIVLTVSKELSGTYNNFIKVAERYNNEKLKISIINTKQNSGAQGLLVKRCAELINESLDMELITDEIRSLIKGSKILIQVKNLDNMVKSGRLSVRAAKIGRRMGMKPIITLDKEGKGSLESIAFSVKGSDKKILKHLNKVLKNHKIMTYCISHVNDIDETKGLIDLAQNLIGFPPEYVVEASSIVAISAGQSAIALSYILEKEAK